MSRMTEAMLNDIEARTGVDAILFSGRTVSWLTAEIRELMAENLQVRAERDHAREKVVRLVGAMREIAKEDAKGGCFATMVDAALDDEVSNG